LLGEYPRDTHGKAVAPFTDLSGHRNAPVSTKYISSRRIVQCWPPRHHLDCRRIGPTRKTLAKHAVPVRMGRITPSLSRVPAAFKAKGGPPWPSFLHARSAQRTIPSTTRRRAECPQTPAPAPMP